jgi:hypothetical protein
MNDHVGDPVSDLVSDPAGVRAGTARDWSEQYVEAGVPFPFPGVRLAITIRHDTFVVGSGFVDGLPAAARLTITYRPSDRVLEWVLLGEFLDSFAARSLSLEEVGEEIFAHVDKVVSPSMLRVELERIDGPSRTTFRVVFE